MARISRGFQGRRPQVEPDRVPPGQYVTRDFPVLYASVAGGLVGWFASGEACEDISCHGTLATMTPGVNSKRPLSRSAD